MKYQSAYDQWIKLGTPYSLGIDLLKSLISEGKSSPLFNLISAKETSFTKIKLKSEIERLLKESSSDSPKSDKKEYGKVDVSKFPKDLQDLYQTIIGNLKSIDFHRGQLLSIFYEHDGKLKKFPDEKTAFHLAKTIHELFLFNLDAWSRIDYFKEKGKYMPGTEPKELTIERLIYLLKKQVQVKDYLYKARKKKEKGLPVNNDVFNEYTSIENEINMLIK